MNNLAAESSGFKPDAATVMHFEVHPSVLFKLGEDLITDDAQALVELIKNSYDADATTVRIDIDTENWYSRDTGEPADAPTGESDRSVVKGRLSITDDGTGMDLDAIRLGWLTVSYSKKRMMKAAGEKTGRSRTPLGDKGLGRLGVQRLGELVKLVSTPATPTSAVLDRPVGILRNEVLIDWSKFAVVETLASVPLEVGTTTIDQIDSGTTISVLGLHNVDYWQGTGDLDLQKELTSILSPYDSAAGVRVFIRINAVEIDMRREARRVLDAAPTTFRFDYANGRLTIKGWTAHTILRGRNAEERAAYAQLIMADGGYSFSEWLMAKKPDRAQELGTESGDDRFFLRFEKSVYLDDAVSSGVAFSDPGPFSGEISSLSYDSNDESAFDRASDLREFAEGLAGIRVFRDGFGIRLDEDWLGLSKQQTTASSYYGLRPRNSAGYVNLSADGNASLEETSSRESFRDTPAWQGFFGLMQQVVTFARATQEFARRNWVVYRRENLSPTGLEDSATPAEIAEHIELQLNKAVTAQVRARNARKALDTLSSAVVDLASSKEESSNAMWTDPALQKAVDQAAADIQIVRQDLSAMFDELEGIFGVMSELKGATGLLHEKLEVAELRISDAWESVALGLSAEMLAHEVDNIAERLRGRSYQNIDYLKNVEPRDARSLAYAEHVRASSAELLRQVGRLNPSLRFRRDRKTEAAVSSLVASAVEYHQSRLVNSRVTIVVEQTRDFTIKINEGKFSQVLDNLILNSEYWVQRHLQQGKVDSGEIRVIIDSPRISIRDNGPGVLPAVQDSLFDAFVTMKPEQQGRGLGLFVVKQLLDSEGASIHLGDHKNAQGRPDTFEADLRALIKGNESESSR
ncbi:putative two-component system sensor histidine kinase, putative heat shock protein [Leifsonia rubra CMS 76R]|nr:putative two-component system sensor histidine kinase, putative heat shock protein [Leifsonia rubra CMS 76R]